ncbi:peptidase M16 family protein [Kribbella swartbergensis]
MTGELRTTEVDGVPVYWVPGQNRLRAGLWFRTGLADESLPTHGWLHLLEHLALHDRGSIRVPVNGYVSMLHTSFDVEGEPEDVADFLQQVCRWLSAPDFADLEHERRVLRAEGAARGTGAVASHLIWRYGAHGPGLAGYDEVGLYTAGEDRLRRLAQQAFTRGNAVLALTGPPPAGLRLPLNEGPRWPIHPAVPCEQPLPGGFAGPSGSVAVSGVLPRSTAAAALLRALQRGLEGGFRHGAGVGYSGWSSYELVDAEHAMLTAGMDILPEALHRAVPETTAVLRRLRDRGIDPVELRDDLEYELRRIKTEPAENWLPFMAARDVLYGRPPTDRDRLAAEVDGVTVADVRQAARTMWNSMLLSVEPAASGDPQLSWHTGPPPARSVPTGQRFKPVGSPVAKGALVVGRSAAHVETDAGETSASYDDLAAVLSYPDGGRVLIRRDGYQLPIEPTLWNRGQEAVAAVDASISPDLRVPLPAREPDEIPRTAVTWRHQAKYWLMTPLPWVALVPVLLLVGILTTDHPLTDLASPGVLLGLALGVTVYLFERRKQ